MTTSNSNSTAGPSNTARPFAFKSVSELLSAPEESVRFCVEDLLPSAGFSVLAGKPKAGKSTVARQLAVAVAQGSDFLGKQTDQGTVMYLAIEEKQSEVAAHFRQLGIKDSDPLLTICGAVQKNEALGRLEAALQAAEDTKLVIIDTIFRFVGVQDSNDYIQVNNALEKLQELARKYGPHIFMVHHMKKRETEDPMDGALGSTAIAGAVDTYLALKVDAEGQRTISTRQRYGTDLPETTLMWDSDSRTLSLGRTCEEAEQESAEATQRRIEREITFYVSGHPGCTQEAIMNAVRGNRSLKLRVFQSLIDHGILSLGGEGVKGAPYTYTLKEIPTEEPPPAGARLPI